MKMPLRIALYLIAGAIGFAGAAKGLSKPVTLLLIVVAIVAVCTVDYRYRRSRGELNDA